MSIFVRLGSSSSMRSRKGGDASASGAGTDTSVFIGVTKMPHGPPFRSHFSTLVSWSLNNHRQALLHVIDYICVLYTSVIHNHSSCSHGNSSRFALLARVRPCPVLTSVMRNELACNNCVMSFTAWGCTRGYWSSALPSFPPATVTDGNFDTDFTVLLRPPMYDSCSIRSSLTPTV